jgi:hypothetical protein
MGASSPDEQEKPPSKKLQTSAIQPHSHSQPDEMSDPVVLKSSAPKLPNELLGRIILQLQRERRYHTLAEFARASKAFYDLAIPKLYETIILTDYSLSKLEYGHSVDSGAGDTAQVEMSKGLEQGCEGSEKEKEQERAMEKEWIQDLKGENSTSHTSLVHQNGNRGDDQASTDEHASNKKPRDDEVMTTSQADTCIVETETRKDAAVKHCRRLIFDIRTARQTRHPYLQTPWIGSNNTMERYINVVEIVLTGRALHETLHVDDLGEDYRHGYYTEQTWFNMLGLLDTIGSESVYAKNVQSHRGNTQRQVILHMRLRMNIGSHNYPWARSPLAGGSILEFPYPSRNRKGDRYCILQVGDFSYVNVRYSEDWRDQQASLLFKRWVDSNLSNPMDPQLCSRRTLDSIARRLDSIFKPLHDVDEAERKLGRLVKDTLPRITLFNLPQIIINKDQLDTLDNINKASRDLLNGRLLELRGVTATLAELIMSHVTLEDLGDRGEEYPWWTPE